MSCAKCGKKAEDGSVFCPECLENMKQYPVKPGTAVYIPVRPEPVERRQTRPRKERTPEEQLTMLRKWVRRLLVLSAALATALVLSLGALVYNLLGIGEPQPQDVPLGRNYTTSATTDWS